MYGVGERVSVFEVLYIVVAATASLELPRTAQKKMRSGCDHNSSAGHHNHLQATGREASALNHSAGLSQLNKAASTEGGTRVLVYVLVAVWDAARDERSCRGSERLVSGDATEQAVGGIWEAVA